MYPGVAQTGATSTIGAGMGCGTMTGAGATITGAGATITGAGSGIPKLIPTFTSATTVVMPKAARARIAIVFFIFFIDWTRRAGKAPL